MGKGREEEKERESKNPRTPGRVNTFAKALPWKQTDQIFETNELIAISWRAGWTSLRIHVLNIIEANWLIQPV